MQGAIEERASAVDEAKPCTNAREETFSGYWPLSGPQAAYTMPWRPGLNVGEKWVLLIDGILGHQAAAKMRNPQAPFRPLSDGNRGELPPLGQVHYASQPL